PRAEAAAYSAPRQPARLWSKSSRTRARRTPPTQAGVQTERRSTEPTDAMIRTSWWWILQHLVHAIDLDRLIGVNVGRELEHRLVLRRAVRFEQHVDHVDRPLVVPNHAQQKEAVELGSPGP